MAERVDLPFIAGTPFGEIKNPKYEYALLNFNDGDTEESYLCFVKQQM